MRQEKILVPEDGERILVVPDCHFPSENRPAIELMCEAAEAINVDRAIHLGDLLDMFSASRWEKDPSLAIEIGSLADEVNSAAWFFDWLNGRKNGWHYLEGNHEKRYTNLINKIPALRNTGHTLDSLIGEKNLRKCTLLRDEWRLVLGNDTVLEHGHLVARSLRPKAEYCVLDDYPEQTTIIGHTHKIFDAIKTVHVRGKPVLRRAYSIGHLSNENRQSYVADPKWQTGFMVLTAYRDNMRNMRLDYHQVVIEHDTRGRPSFALHGKVYR